MPEILRPTQEGSNILRVLEDANKGRNLDIYQGYMSAATLAKAMSIFPHFGNVRPGAIIVDVGSGTGDVAELAARVFRGTHLIGVDISRDLILPASTNRSLVSYVRADGTKQNFMNDSIDIKMYGTIGHEIESFGGQGKMKDALSASFRELKPGGIIIVRDFLMPDGKDPWFMQLHETKGVQTLAHAMRNGRVDYTLLSKKALLKEFHQDFTVHRKSGSGPAFSYQIVIIDGREYVKIHPKWGHEFVLRKDYADNYLNEINEEYLYWTANSGKQALEETGFVNVQMIPDPNKYIKENRIEGKVTIHKQSRSGKLRRIEYPDTHGIWIGVKPDTKKSYSGFSLIDYDQIVNTVTYDENEEKISVGDKVFYIDPNYPCIKGSKKMVFRLKDNPTQMLKVIRTDTVNNATVLKAMTEAIDFEYILDEYAVAHTAILEVDSNIPPRFVIQQAIGSNSISAAELIKNNQLSEIDIQQMAHIVNTFEVEGKWQLDTNPFNWYRVVQDDGTTQMTYVDGKVYTYEKSWEFTRVGLLQWINPEYVSHVDTASAQIPKVKDYEAFTSSWGSNTSEVANWWKKYLDPKLLPTSL